MADDAPRSTRAPGWAGSVGWWLVAWLVVSIAIVVSAVLAALFGMSLAAQPSPPGSPLLDVEAAPRMEAATLPLRIGVSAAAALLAGLPLQVGALHLRRQGDGSGVLASVAVLTCLSAMLSFAVLCWRYAVYAELLRPSALLLATLLAGFYLMHVIILHVARAMAARRMPAETTT